VFLGSLPLVAIHRLRASFVIATFLDEMPTVLVSLPIILIANIAGGGAFHFNGKIGKFVEFKPRAMSI
jgi:hypothetical protein